jgi:hypothetical protein
MKFRVFLMDREQKRIKKEAQDRLEQMPMVLSKFLLNRLKNLSKYCLVSRNRRSGVQNKKRLGLKNRVLWSMSKLKKWTQWLNIFPLLVDVYIIL